jgi:26 proteasome complex subunit DSS1
MSGAPASGSAPQTTKAGTSDKTAEPTKEVKPAAALEEDDEFEDFPVESMLLFLPDLVSREEEELTVAR